MQSRVLVIGGLSLVVLVAGCTHNARTASHRRTLNLAPGQEAHGYIEFYARTNNAVIPIYRANKNATPQLISAVGLKAGDKYNVSRTPVVVAERLRITAPTGQTRFMIDGQGPLISVPVSEGKTTPVVIDYKLIERGETLVVYRADARVLEPLVTNIEK